MRKLLAIVLLLLFSVPVAAPLVAAMRGNDDASLPACCRKHGKHHCAMSQERVQSREAAAADPDQGAQVMRVLKAAREACPYDGVLQSQRHSDPASATVVLQRLLTQLRSDPAVQAQVESRWRIARERARGKRGPPPLLPIPLSDLLLPSIASGNIASPAQLA